MEIDDTTIIAGLLHDVVEDTTVSAEEIEEKQDENSKNTSGSITAINEKIYRNGDSEIKLPLKLLIAASNELPAHGEGLEALWDRFLLRIICTCVKDEQTFYNMLLDDNDKEINVPSELQISEKEYAD